MIIGVGSWRGTGATTTALLLAASIAASSDSEPCWLIEADPAGGVLAARLALPRDAAGALERIAFPTGRSASTTDRFADVAAHVGPLRVVTAPGDPFRAWACHTPRLAWASLLRELDGTVVVDLGRMRGGSPLGALVAQLDLVLLTSVPDPVSLLADAMWIESSGRVSPAESGSPVSAARLVVIDSPAVVERIGRTTVERELGHHLAAWLPWSPTTVDAVMRGESLDDRRLRRQLLTISIEDLASRLPLLATQQVTA